MKPDDNRPARGNWAPGKYLNKCGSCNDQFVGGHHASACAPCAYNDGKKFLVAIIEEGDLQAAWSRLNSVFCAAINCKNETGSFPRFILTNDGDIRYTDDPTKWFPPFKITKGLPPDQNPLWVAARELLYFLNKNVDREPDRATEWPMSLICRDQETAKTLAGLLTKLEIETGLRPK